MAFFFRFGTFLTVVLLLLARPVQAADLCTEADWICSPWTPCTSWTPTQQRVCGRLNPACENGLAPEVTRSCADQIRPCTEADWVCAPWTFCWAGQAERVCALQAIDCQGGYTPPSVSSCAESTPPPALPSLPACTTATVGWRCTGWTACSAAGVQYRTCDYNRDVCTLTTAEVQAEEIQSCTPDIPPTGTPTPSTPPPSPSLPPASTGCSADVWDCSDWSACRIFGSDQATTETRTCVLAYDCPFVASTQPALEQACAAPSTSAPLRQCPFAGFIPPSHTGTVMPEALCRWRYDTENTEIRLGQAHLPSVWNDPFDFHVPDKFAAMGTAFAGSIFGIDPNYLNAIATKESRADCIQANHDGCHQIESFAFQELTLRFPNHLAGANHADYVERWDRSAIAAAFHFRLSEGLFRLWYPWDTFGQSALDPEAQTKLMTRAFNRGQWDQNIQTILTSNFSQCVAAPELVAACYDNHDIARDHTEAVLSYCRAYRADPNVYDAIITRTDIQQFITDTVRPFYEQPWIDWAAIQSLADDMFTCLADANDVISFRYDFATIIQAIRPSLPPIQTPYNIDIDFGR